MRKYSIWIISITLLTLPFSLLSPKEVFAHPPAQDSPPTPAEVIEAINALRIANGLLPLNTHPVLMQVAQWEANAIAGGAGGHTRPDLSQVRLLDIGCGGGVLAEEFARLGCQVTGLDIAVESIAVARAHARSEGLLIDYQTGSATQLPFDGSSIKVVSCCDVLEHVPEWEQVIVEVERVLVPGGLFLFDTINRTAKSKSTFIFGLQEWSFTKLFPRDTHVWEMFIAPDELTSALEKHGMTVKGFSGGAIARNPLSTLQEVRRHKRGKISVAELGRRLELKHDPDLSLNYLGYALKG